MMTRLIRIAVFVLIFTTSSPTFVGFFVCKGSIKGF